MAFIFVYVTNPGRKDAEMIATHLLKRKLIACANIFPIHSSYWWKGKIEKSREFVMIAKTKKQNWKKVKMEIKKMHPYTVPCITKIEVEANKKYENWIGDAVD